MARTPVTLSRFGGLDLAQTPNLIEGDRAMDALNVELGSRGAIRSRGGYAAFTGALTNQPDSLGVFLKSDGTKRLLVGNSTSIDVLDTAGTSVANTTSPTASPHFFTQFGGPTIEAVYIANGTDQVRRYDTAGGFTTPAGLAGQTGKFLAVTPTSNRLVVARESGSTAGNNPASINFSNPGAPEIFTSTDFIDLEPGGGPITGLITWGDYIFAFKERKFWHYYGESTDSTGGAIFNFTAHDTGGVGLVAPRALASTPSGVFFLDRTGVFLTNGSSSPVKVSADIDSFFTDKVQGYFESQPINQGAIASSAMCWHENHLYVAVPTGASTVNDRVLVLNPVTKDWTLYDLPAAAMASFAISSLPELVFARSATSKTIARHKTGEDRYANDDMSTTGTGGSAITARWRSGWTNMDSTSEKNIHDADLYGTGHATVTVLRDYARADPLGTFSQNIIFTSEESLWDSFVWDVDVWGPTGILTRKTLLKGFPATVVSLAIENAALDQSFQLNECTFFVTGERPPGLKHR